MIVHLVHHIHSKRITSATPTRAYYDISHEHDDIMYAVHKSPFNINKAYINLSQG